MPGANQAWVCTVCGYIHRGAEPPQTCPVCGAPRELFEPQAGALPPPPGADASRWRCLDCGYIHVGSQPPTKCPDCGAPAERFELLSKTAEVVAEHIEPLSETAGARAIKVVVVGAGIAGVAAVESLRARLAHGRDHRHLEGDRAAVLPAQSDPVSCRRDRRSGLAAPPSRLVRRAERPAPARGRGGDNPIGRPFGRVARRREVALRQVALGRRGPSVYPAVSGNGSSGRDQPADARGRPPHPGGLPRRRPMRLHRRRTAGAGNSRRTGPARGQRHLAGRPWLAAAAAVEPTRREKSSTAMSPPPASNFAIRPSRGNSSAMDASKGSCWRTARFFPPT